MNTIIPWVGFKKEYMKSASYIEKELNVSINRELVFGNQIVESSKNNQYKVILLNKNIREGILEIPEQIKNNPNDSLILEYIVKEIQKNSNSNSNIIIINQANSNYIKPHYNLSNIDIFTFYKQEQQEKEKLSNLINSYLQK